MNSFSWNESNDFLGLKVTVMGLGLFGGGAGVTRFLAERGAKVTVTDLRSPKELSKGLAEIEGLPLRIVLGKHREEDFQNVDLVVANPAVPPDSPFLRMAVERGIPVESEMNLTFKYLPSANVVGVTGSNGKTTTSHLIYQMIKATGRKAWLGGNVGGSLLPSISQIDGDDFVVLELSSFQLERTGEKKIGPKIAVITNITPNHLDRHKDFDSYIRAKAQILLRAEGVVLNGEDPVSMERFRHLTMQNLRFSSKRELEEGYFLRGDHIIERLKNKERKLMNIKGITLPGVFNLENIMAALAGFRLILGIESCPQASLSAAAHFKGVPHRLEVVAAKRGVKYINDSIATTPDSCLAALEVLGGDIHLIAGGYDKGLPLETLAEAVILKTKSVFLLGQTGPKLERAMQGVAHRKGQALPNLERIESLESAVEKAAKIALPDSTVLLSPGFASYDQFLNFAERGELFKRLVADL